jgi:hypothetical protein
MAPGAGADSGPFDKWEGHETTEKMISDIQGRYAEAQALLTRHSAL